MDHFAFATPESPFSVKDLMLGELLCQAGILSDAQILRSITIAKIFGSTIGAAICQIGFLTTRELFRARRILNCYLSNPDNIDDILSLLRNSLGSQARRQECVPELTGMQLAAKAS